MPDVIWRLRYRSTLSPTRGVDEVNIATKTADPVKARAVAEFWLARSMSHQSTKFIDVRPFLACTEDELLAEQKAAKVPA